MNRVLKGVIILYRIIRESLSDEGDNRPVESKGMSAVANLWE